ncbi:MAG: efflux RND transporter periplasmic adaptor subunit [Planctomycetota bacterium]|nr:efflux RND transporter periplasmic adaptor subunit [Planctomycetota bacterium]
MASESKNKLTFAVGVGLIVVAGGASLYFKSKADSMLQASEVEQAVPLTIVAVHEVKPTQRPLRFAVRGVLEGVQEITVSTEVQGLAVGKVVHEGQIVEPGDTICHIDPTFHTHSLEQAEAELKRAEAVLANAEAVLGHARELRTDVTTELEQKQRLAERDQAQAAKDIAHSQVAQAKERLARCKISSPIFGAINRVFYEDGELLTPMSPIVEIIDLSTMKLVVDLTDFEAAQLAIGDTVTIASPAWPGASFEGTVHSIYPKANPLTRRVPIEIHLQNADGKLRSGSFVSCVIESATTTPKLLVPAKGVLHDFGTDYCYIAEPHNEHHIVQRRKIRISPWPGSVSVVAVVAGLQEGDLLILNKHHEVAIEQTVTARRASVGSDSGSSHTTDQ